MGHRGSCPLKVIMKNILLLLGFQVCENASIRAHTKYKVNPSVRLARCLPCGHQLTCPAWEDIWPLTRPTEQYLRSSPVFDARIPGNCCLVDRVRSLPQRWCRLMTLDGGNYFWLLISANLYLHKDSFVRYLDVFHIGYNVRIFQTVHEKSISW